MRETPRWSAIKVLPEAFIEDPERLARFEREARVLASLNHPHIAGIHQVEEADGLRLLVMELVPREDLGERDRASGPQASQYQHHTRGPGQGTRLRSRIPWPRF